MFFVNRFLVGLVIIGEFPGGVVFDHDVEDAQEFVHAGDEADAVGFPGVFESVPELVEDWVAADGVEGGHVEGVANGFSASSNGFGFRRFSAVPIDGRDAYQGGDFPAVELPEFGEFGDQGGGGSGTDSGDTGEDFGEVLPVVIGIDEFGDLFVEFFESEFQEGDDLVDIFLDGWVPGGFPMILLLGEKFHELSSASDEGVDFLLFFRGKWGEVEFLDAFGELDEDLGIEGVGLGEDVEGVCEGTDSSGGEDGDEVFSFGEKDEEVEVVVAGGFENDLAVLGGGEQLEKFVKTGFIVGEFLDV